MYASRHVERDNRLPDHRGRLLESALVDLSQDSDVVGVYITGSLARGNPDLYSDIDLHIVVKSDAKATFVKRKYDRPARWGDVLFYEDVSPQRPMVVVHFECFVKIDTWYHQSDELKPSIWLTHCRALYDPHQLLQPIFTQSATLEYQPTSQEIELWRGKIFAAIHEIYRRVMRDELFYALAQLDSFRWQMARGWYMEMGRRVESGWGDWAKFEGSQSHLESWQAVLLRSWHCELSGQAVMRTTAAMIPEFMRLHCCLCRATSLEERHEWCEQILSKVL